MKKYPIILLCYIIAFHLNEYNNNNNNNNNNNKNHAKHLSKASYI